MLLVRAETPTFEPARIIGDDLPYWLRGWAELALAVVCLGTFVLIAILSSHGPVFVLPGIFLLAMFMFVGDGAARLRRSRAIRHFA